MGIPESVMKRLIAVFEKNKSIDKVFLFGSRARGDNRYNSDIDLAIKGDRIRSSVIMDIKDAVGLYKVDVLNLSDELDNSFREELEKDILLIYDKELYNVDL